MPPILSSITIINLSIFKLSICNLPSPRCLDNANRVQKLQARLGVMLRCSLSYAKIVFFHVCSKCFFCFLNISFRFSTGSWHNTSVMAAWFLISSWILILDEEVVDTFRHSSDCSRIGQRRWHLQPAGSSAHQECRCQACKPAPRRHLHHQRQKVSAEVKQLKKRLCRQTERHRLVDIQKGW